MNSLVSLLDELHDQDIALHSRAWSIAWAIEKFENIPPGVLIGAAVEVDHFAPFTFDPESGQLHKRPNLPLFDILPSATSRLPEASQ